jgi:serine/threonine protein kinase
MTICEITLPEDMIAIICQMTLRGLDYLHKSRKIHRDVKSGNILLNAKGEIKLGAHLHSLAAFIFIFISTLMIRYKSAVNCHPPSRLWRLGATRVDHVETADSHWHSVLDGARGTVSLHCVRLMAFSSFLHSINSPISVPCLVPRLPGAEREQV